MSNTTQLRNSLALFSQQAHQHGDAKDIATRSLAVALLQLMQDKPFDMISITELTRTAGVSRMTYYRHYQHKQQVLTDYLVQIDSDLPWVDLTNADKQTTFKFLVNLFKVLQRFELSTHILVSQGFEALILAIFNQSKFLHALDDLQHAEETVYRRLFVSGMLANTYLHWVKTGQTQTPEQLATWLIRAGWYELLNEF